MSRYIPLDHPRFVKVQRDVFLEKVVADCMAHGCRQVAGDRRERLDACCQYGVDVDVGERDAILAHRAEIAAILNDQVADVPWFSDQETADPDFPSGRYVRSASDPRGCIFLAHKHRGCAIHRASVASHESEALSWDYRGVKPHVCRLFPLSYESDAIVLSDDYADYSCAYIADAPSVYQVGRDVLADVFGQDLVRAMDEAEARVLGERARLHIIRTNRTANQ